MSVPACDYLSTACWHAQYETGGRATFLHKYHCSKVCEFCEQPCSCECHKEIKT